MIKNLPCDIHDCKNHNSGFCKLTYPTMEYFKIDKKMRVMCGDYEEVPSKLHNYEMLNNNEDRPDEQLNQPFEI